MAERRQVDWLLEFLLVWGFRDRPSTPIDWTGGEGEGKGVSGGGGGVVGGAGVCGGRGTGKSLWWWWR